MDSKELNFAQKSHAREGKIKPGTEEKVDSQEEISQS